MTEYKHFCENVIMVQTLNIHYHFINHFIQILIAHSLDKN